MTASAADRTPLKLTAREPEDLIAAAPLMLGFAPADSVVMMTFGGARAFHARTDLPPGEVLTSEVAEALAASLVGPAGRQRVAAVVLLIYSDRAAPAARAWRSLRRACGRAGIQIITALRVEDGRYFPFLGDRRLREVGVPFDVAGHRFAAEGVLGGQVTYPSREDLVATLDPDPGARASVDAALAERGGDDRSLPRTRRESATACDWASALVARHLDRATAPPAGEQARLLRLLRDERVADALRASIDRDTGEAHLTFWSRILRGAPDSLLAAPAGLTAWAAWRAGRGALAWAAVDRCRAVAPDDRLAGLVAHLLEQAVPPDVDAAPDPGEDRCQSA